MCFKSNKDYYQNPTEYVIIDNIYNIYTYMHIIGDIYVHIYHRWYTHMHAHTDTHTHIYTHIHKYINT